MLLAVFDLGSNSFKVTVAQYMGSDARIPFKIVHKERHPVQFGASVFGDKKISNRHRVLGLKALQSMRDSVLRFQVPLVRIVGTSAIREATNGKAFVDEVAKKLGLSIEVISGVEEARIIAGGLEWEYPFVDSGLLIDIGGGSTEIAQFGRGWKKAIEKSFPLGSVRLALEWEKGRRKISIEEDLRRRVRKTLLRQRAPKSFDYLVGSAGAIQTLGGILTSKRKNTTIRKKGIDKWIAEVVHTSADELQVSYNLAPSRARVVVPGAIILSELLRWLGEDEIFVTEMTLRNGMLVDFIARLQEMNWIID